MEASHGVFLASVNIFSRFFFFFSYYLSKLLWSEWWLTWELGIGISFVFIGRAMQVNHEEHDGD